MLANDAAAIVADLPVVIGYNGGSYTVTPTEANRTQAMEFAGVGVSYDCAFFGLVADFGTPPQQNEIITYDGRSYQVERTILVQDGKTFTIFCKARF
jgi:hypothetical protein